MESNYLAGKTVLITGGTGTFGEFFLDYATKLDSGPHKIIVLSRNELRQVEMERRFHGPNLRYFLGDIRDRERLLRAFYGVDVVIHAAALKHVPKCHYNPSEALKTNCDGTQNVVDACIGAGVGKLIAISTDKAVNPISAYGAAKLLADHLIIDGNVYSGGDITRCSVARFGNFVASTGSVIPLWRELVAAGKPIILTDQVATRFFIKPPDVVTFIVKCLAEMEGGEIFSPKMKTIRMLDLARAIQPDDGKIIIDRLSNGEKKHEEMITHEMAPYTVERSGHFVTYQERQDGAVHPEFTYNSQNCGEVWEPQDLLR